MSKNALLTLVSREMQGPINEAYQGLSGRESARHCRRCMFGPQAGKISGEGMATHSNSLAWKIPWTEEPRGLQSMGSQKSQAQLSD